MNNRIVSNRHEANVAKALEGRKTANSGATPFSKGDVIAGSCIIECKTKTKTVNSFAIRKEWLDEINEEKIGMGKTLAALAFSFNEGEDSYYVIDEKAMKMLVGLINSI